MKKSFYKYSIAGLLCLLGIPIFFFKNSFPYENLFIVEQKLIPILYPHPKDKVYAYVHNANVLFTYSANESDMQRSLALSYRAEHSMTLTVEEVRRLPDSGVIPFTLIRDTYDRHKKILKRLTENSNGSIQDQFMILLSISTQNEQTTKNIYYNRTQPANPIPL